LLANREQDLARRRVRDLVFLAAVKRASLSFLIILWRDHNHGQVPLWKLVAIERGFVRLGLNPPRRPAWRRRKEREALKHPEPSLRVYGARMW